MSAIDRRTLVAAGLSAFGGAALGCRAREARLDARTDGSNRARLEYVFPSTPTREGQGAFVHRIFPSRHLRHLDPFVLLDDFRVAEPAGFPTHPHRGFEAFTYMLEGSFHHKDDLGNDSVVSAGGTQRFTSGRGARHSEMPYGAGENRGLQLWVNLPRAEKAIAPSYAPTDDRAHFVDEGRGVRAREVVGARSPVELRTRVAYFDVALERGRSYELDLREGDASLLYAIAGNLRVRDQTLSEHFAAVATPGTLEVTALEDARLLVLSGRPHGEPIFQHGPFVD